MKNLLKTIIIILVLFISNVRAYTVDDIIAKTDEIKPCSTQTESILNGLKSSYKRLFNERIVTDNDMNKIYNNVDYVVNFLKENNICKEEDKSKLSKEQTEYLYSLYDETNDLIINSKVKTTNEKEDINIVINKSEDVIKVYEDNKVSTVIKTNNVLNYVGTNKILVYSFYILIIIYIISILFLFKCPIVLVKSIVMVLTFLLPTLFIFKNYISRAYDMIYSFSINDNNENTKVITEKNSIISYPSVGQLYASLNIKDEEDNIYYGDTEKILKNGIGQDSTSVFPGEEGTTILSGHNTGLLKTLFYLNINDKAEIKTTYGKFLYSLKDYRIINNNELSYLKTNHDLIIYTCYPNNSIYTNKRLVLYFDLIKETWENNYEENN